MAGFGDPSSPRKDDLVTRRSFVVAFLSMAVCYPLVGRSNRAHAQRQPSPRRIGVLLTSWLPKDNEVQQFRRGLQDLGYVEEQNVVIEWRAANGDYNRLPQLAVDLVTSKVDILVVDGTVATRAAKRATSTIPIVMALVADPVGTGLVANLAHPGENITGLTMMIPDSSAKRLQLLKEVIPRLTRVAVLWNPDTPYTRDVIKELKTAARSLSVELSFVSVRDPKEFDEAFASIRQAHVGALYVIEDSLLTTHRAALIKLASKAHLPSISGVREYVDAGALISYGPNIADMFRRTAEYVDRILKGAKPADLPIEQPTKFDLAVNLKTAKSLGITVPESILLRADEVIR
jgi:putative ABC transport system substrate-binding protein